MINLLKWNSSSKLNKISIRPIKWKPCSEKSPVSNKKCLTQKHSKLYNFNAFYFPVIIPFLQTTICKVDKNNYPDVFQFEFVRVVIIIPLAPAVKRCQNPFQEQKTDNYGLSNHYADGILGWVRKKWVGGGRGDVEEKC